MTPNNVFAVADDAQALSNGLKGKGAHLAGPTDNSPPAPSGFTVSSPSGHVHLLNSRPPTQRPAQVEDLPSVKDYLQLRPQTGRQILGQADKPILVVVRPCENRSKSGMFETMLHDKLEDKTIRGPTGRASNERLSVPYVLALVPQPRLGRVRVHAGQARRKSDANFRGSDHE